MRAMAKSVITSTPKITSTNVTGRDYLKANADLHNRGEFCTGRPELIMGSANNAKAKKLRPFSQG
jgi:hypothetical protein